MQDVLIFINCFKNYQLLTNQSPLENETEEFLFNFYIKTVLDIYCIIVSFQLSELHAHKSTRPQPARVAAATPSSACKQEGVLLRLLKWRQC